MPEELEQVVATIETATVPGTVDENPQTTEAIQAEITRLQAVREEAEKKAKEAEEKAVYWRKEKARERTEYFTGRRGETIPPTPADKVPETIAPPRKEDFDDYDKYVEAVADYKAEVKVAKWKKDESEKSQQTEYQRKMTDLRAKIDRGFEKYPDFEEVARDPSVPITPMVVDILAESETPEDVAYYLGKNRAEAIRISRLSPFAAAKEIGRIEMEIAKQRGNQPPPKLPGAPPPIKPVGSSETGIVKDPEKMTQREYEEWRKSQGAKPF